MDTIPCAHFPLPFLYNGSLGQMQFHVGAQFKDQTLSKPLVSGAGQGPPSRKGKPMFGIGVKPSVEGLSAWTYCRSLFSSEAHK